MVIPHQSHRIRINSELVDVWVCVQDTLTLLIKAVETHRPCISDLLHNLLNQQSLQTQTHASSSNDQVTEMAAAETRQAEYLAEEVATSTEASPPPSPIYKDFQKWVRNKSDLPPVKFHKDGLMERKLQQLVYITNGSITIQTN
ncbi:LOW QUALITY PROTEIN: hypothetical protein HID58_076385 [Brassica napus]|uniref:Uncharacterized protein n=1 Tax=Brassica napus TaxID=3708 RepID=A0ABQ7YML5_BRANA|nr:LOW QUALITY PROTEIN: hypothetical protein HID58_076385 [Brassica napus]